MTIKSGLHSEMRLEGSLSIEILIYDELYVHRNQLDQFFLDEIS